MLKMRGAKSIVDCVSSPFSAVIKFQKQFVDDVIVNVKKRSEELDRYNHEWRNRKVRLYLDHLEEEYLCCVCGKPGVDRDSDDTVTDEFSIIHMPSKERIEQAIISSGQSSESGQHTGLGNSQALNPEVYALLGVLSTSTERDTRKMVAKVQHAILNQEAADKQRGKKSSHRDKGLMKIEEADIDMFEEFFKRPVHGYLCLECHISAKKRLDALTSQIQGILFRGKTPFLRNSSTNGSYIGNTGVGGGGVGVCAIATIKSQGQERTSSKVSPAAKHSRLVSNVKEHDLVTLPDAAILYLRANVRCAVCKRRQACFFIRQSVAFLCQFCCARDRFYRDNAVCINDELMSRETAHLLRTLAYHYERTKGEDKVNPLSSSNEKSRVDLFLEYNNIDLVAAMPPLYVSIDVEPMLPYPPSSLDRRSVAGNTSVSLFKGKTFSLNLGESDIL
ncbi:uncharacterized protein TM35_000045580 [Trypanosoma theileri]|uniref:Uncharacterized protein n=1 Tax=Trypanosoma theileri TaxID=67003 RepID=A0A1X0P5X6_9TRYP|nr:uncharacterized protein TM35_000045580 [Trypanosoma theileri]ORC92344.1 hypothetical protein TM35_000045580 [Trypanosoma theileri]